MLLFVLNTVNFEDVVQDGDAQKLRFMIAGCSLCFSLMLINEHHLTGNFFPQEQKLHFTRYTQKKHAFYERWKEMYVALQGEDVQIIGIQAIGIKLKGIRSLHGFPVDEL